MIDVTTNTPLRVVAADFGPHMRLPYVQVKKVRQVLDAHGVNYWVSESVLSLNGGPEIATIYFGRNVDARTVQTILDDAG